MGIWHWKTFSTVRRILRICWCIAPICYSQPARSTANIRFVHTSHWVEMMLIINEMELINECSMRFAEDKDFRLLVLYTALFWLRDADSLYSDCWQYHGLVSCGFFRTRWTQREAAKGVRSFTRSDMDIYLPDGSSWHRCFLSWRSWPKNITSHPFYVYVNH